MIVNSSIITGGALESEGLTRRSPCSKERKDSSL